MLRCVCDTVVEIVPRAAATPQRLSLLPHVRFIMLQYQTDDTFAMLPRRLLRAGCGLAVLLQLLTCVCVRAHACVHAQGCALQAQQVLEAGRGELAVAVAVALVDMGGRYADTKPTNQPPRCAALRCAALCCAVLVADCIGLDWTGLA